MVLVGRDQRKILIVIWWNVAISLRLPTGDFYDAGFDPAIGSNS
jgi:hypothetical protein